mmetsp:Transcript_24801/g.71610  ORF Transcript_24801/g.71610 Transcript_24801/m.71610 type:complete len:589 (-) Transcript_24801:840-2606(-)
MAEVDRASLPAMLATDARLKIGVALLAAVARYLHQLAHTVLVEYVKRVVVEDLYLLLALPGVLHPTDVGRHEVAAVVAADAKRRLREVVGAEGEELGQLGDLFRPQSGPRQLYHGAHFVGQRHAAPLKRSLGRVVDDGLLVAEFVLAGDERHHDLGHDRLALLGHLHRRLKYGLGLHLCEVREEDTQSAATVTQHGVSLSYGLADAKEFLEGCVHGVRQLLQLLLVVRHELVAGRIQQTNCRGVSIHRAKDLNEVTLLILEQHRDSLFSVLLSLREEHLPHVGQPLLVHEHVLRPCEADALRPQGPGHLCVPARVCVGVHPEASVLVCEGHDGVELLEGLALLGKLRLVDQHLQHFRGCGVEFGEVDLARGAVDADRIPLPQHHTRPLHTHKVLLTVVAKRPTSAHTRLADAPSHHGSMARRPAAHRQHPLGRNHARKVFWRSLLSDKDALDAFGFHLDGFLRGEDGHAGCGAGAGVEASGGEMGGGALFLLWVEDWGQKLHQLLWLDAHNEFLLVNEPFVEHVECDVDGRQPGPLARPGLQHEQPPLVNRELQVLHVPEVGLELLRRLHQLLVGLGHRLLQSGKVGA